MTFMPRCIRSKRSKKSRADSTLAISYVRESNPGNTGIYTVGSVDAKKTMTLHTHTFLTLGNIRALFP